MILVSRYIKDYFLRYETIVIILTLVFFSSYFFVNRFFITLDGSAHLYNAELIEAKLAGNFESINHYFSWNSELVPNLSTHFILLVLKLFLKAGDAEKVFLTLYLFSFVFSFRYLIRSFNKENGILSLLAIPFALSTFLYYGFYNFSFALVMMFLVIGYWERNKNFLSIKKTILLFFIVLLVYFSHLSVFMLLLLVFSCSLFFDSIQSFLARNLETRRLLFRKTVGMFLVCLAPLVLGVIYFLNRADSTSLSYLSVSEIMYQFYHVQPCVTYGIPENYYTAFLFILLSVLFVVVIFLRIKDRKTLEFNDFILVVALLLFMALFIVPDSDSKGGFVIIRMILLLYLILLLWISIQRTLTVIIPIALFVVLYTSIGLLHLRAETQQGFSKMASEIYSASEYIKPGDVVLPVWKSYDWDWISSHYSNYLGIDKPVVILENYEASQDYFPLLWGKNLALDPVYDISNSFLCNSYLPDLNSKTVLPDHIVIFGLEINKIGECDEEMNDLLENHYHLTYESVRCRLFSFEK